MGRLDEYVRDARARGYSDVQVRAGLVRAGYSKVVVDGALRALPGLSRRRSFGWFVVVFCGFVVLSVLFYFFFKVPSVVFEVRIPSQLVVSPGGTLVFERVVEAKGADVRILYSLAQGERIVGQKSESLRVVGRNVAKVRLPVPLVPGEYVVLAELGGQHESFVINVEGLVVPEKNVSFAFVPEKVVGCPQGCDDFNTCTLDVCAEGVCQHDVVLPCCGNGQCEQGEGFSCVQDCAAKVVSSEEIAQKASGAVEVDASLAVSLCQSIPQGVKADACLYDAARKADVAQVCSSIAEVRTRDSCFMEFALRNDFSICSQVSHDFLQRNCYSLERLKRQQVELESTEA